MPCPCHCRSLRPSLCSLSRLVRGPGQLASTSQAALSGSWHWGHQLMSVKPLLRCYYLLYCTHNLFQTMSRKMFGLYRSYRLGMGDVFGMVLLGLLVLAAIAIAVFTNTANVHPGMLGLVVVAFIIVMFALICGWDNNTILKISSGEHKWKVKALLSSSVIYCTLCGS